MLVEATRRGEGEEKRSSHVTRGRHGRSAGGHEHVRGGGAGGGGPGLAVVRRGICDGQRILLVDWHGARLSTFTLEMVLIACWLLQQEAGTVDIGGWMPRLCSDVKLRDSKLLTKRKKSVKRGRGGGAGAGRT